MRGYSCRRDNCREWPRRRRGCARIPREELAAKLLRRTVLLADATAWNLKLAETIAGRDRPLERAVPITLTPFGALMSRGSQCGGELRLERGFDGFSDMLTQLGFEVLAETQNRRMVHALRATLLHGVPPSPLISAICLASREVTPFLLIKRVGTDRDGHGRTLIQIGHGQTRTDTDSDLPRTDTDEHGFRSATDGHGRALTQICPGRTRTSTDSDLPRTDTDEH